MPRHDAIRPAKGTFGRIRILLLLTLFVAAVPACSSCDGGPSPDACGRGLLPRKLSMHWKKLNHRVSLLGYANSADGETLCPALPGATDVFVRGGDWSTGSRMKDTPQMDVAWHAVDATRKGDPPHAAFARLTATFKLGPQASAKDHISRGNAKLAFDLSALKLYGFGNYQPAIAGYRIKTDIPQAEGYPSSYDPSHGYTLAHFSAQVGKPVGNADGALVVPVDVALGWGPSDRKDMNAALEKAVFSVEIDVVMVAFEGSFKDWSHTYLLKYGKPELGKEVEQPRASAKQRRVSVTGDPDIPQVLPVWQRIVHTLRTEGYHGFYIRALSDGLKVLSGPDKKGTIVLDVDGYAATRSLIDYHQLTHEYTAAGKVLQLEGEAKIGSVGGAREAKLEKDTIKHARLTQ